MPDTIHSIYLKASIDLNKNVIMASGMSSIPFTDGDTMRRVTIPNPHVRTDSKIIGLVTRPNTVDDSEDAGYVYTYNVVSQASGSFDLSLVCLSWGVDDPTEIPPNETIQFNYFVMKL